MENKKEMTAPNVSVGADTEQPIQKIAENSIYEYEENIKSFEEMQREMQLSLDPSYLKAVSMNELFDTQYQSKPPLIDGLLYPGTYIFAGSPKLGKSFLMAQLAYHVSTGTPLWNYTTRKGTVLYLALEDDYRRLQERLYRMFGTESADNLFFSVSAGQLGKGLDEQLARFVAEHTDTKLIIIDTLQKVREVGGDNYSYANDYQIMAMKKIGKNNPKAEEIKADNAARQEWNRTVDVALVEGVPEEDILKIKQEKITDETLQSIRTHGWLPDMFRQIIRGAKDFLQEVIFKFKLPPRTVPKIDLQEWKDMQKLMYELQGQSREIKRTQQDISSLKKQLSELRGLFKGKERKSLEGKIELLEDLEKRLHRSMGRIVKREGYPNVQSFQKVYNKAEELIMEYNEELRAWKNQTKPKKENPLEQPQKASVLEKLHRYQQEGRQQPKRSVKKKSMDRER